MSVYLDYNLPTPGLLIDNPKPTREGRDQSPTVQGHPGHRFKPHKTEPIGTRTEPDDLNTGLICYSDTQ